MFEMIPKILPFAVIPVCVGFFLMCGFISWKVYGKKATIWSLTAAPEYSGTRDTSVRAFGNQHSGK